MFEIYRSDANDKYHFRLKAANGEIIFTGQGYKAKQDCLNGIESVRANAPNEGSFEIWDAKDGRQYFVLKATNGEIIGQSQMYKSSSGLRNGLASVQENSTAECQDLT
jgi:uncharacterized protein YegP (UPF0339 family)